MPPKRKAPTPSVAPQLAAALPTSDYKTFLGGLINKPPAKLKAAAINKWRDIPATPQGQIVNDIAKKFNTMTPPLGINQLVYTKGAGQPNYYEGLTQTGKTRMTLAPPPRGKIGDGPDPSIVGHELMHANDHQIDQLNPKIWRNLGTLATTGGIPTRSGTPTPIADFGAFQSSLGRIQDKVDLTGAFSPQYPIDQAYVQQEMQGVNGSPYSAPFIVKGKKSIPDWPQLFTDINAAVTSPPPAGGVQNHGFYLNRASEFPSFMSENLTRPWGTNTGANPLTKPEARFLYNTLGDMSTAYPANDPTTGAPAYTTMNQHIGTRRNSIADAYYPPQPGGTPGSGVPTTGFSKGGKIKAKSKKRGLFSYFKD